MLGKEILLLRLLTQHDCVGLTGHSCAVVVSYTLILHFISSFCESSKRGYM